VATFVPIETLKGFDLGLISLTVTALIGVFLPVPIAFDVVITGALLNGGLTVGYVMVLLFTLGIFSVYSFMIVATTISFRAASMLCGVIVVAGIMAGFGAEALATDEAEALGQMAEKHVLGHAQIVDQVEFLHHHLHAGILGFPDGSGCIGLAEEPHAPGAGLEPAGDNVAKSRLAGTVCTGECMDLAGPQLEVDAF